MRAINIHQAKTHLSRLVEEAAKGQGFIIAKAGKPMVRVVAIDPEAADLSNRIGFARDLFALPDTFDTAFGDLDGDIAEAFLAGGLLAGDKAR